MTNQMSKPMLKAEVAVTMIYPPLRFIVLYATPDAASEFEKFGEMFAESPSRFHLFVDARYDFDEIVTYIENYDTVTH